MPFNDLSKDPIWIYVNYARDFEEMLKHKDDFTSEYLLTAFKLIDDQFKALAKLKTKNGV